MEGVGCDAGSVAEDTATCWVGEHCVAKSVDEEWGCGCFTKCCNEVWGFCQYLCS